MSLVTITWDDVVAVAPALATVPTASQEAILDRVALVVVNPDWGALANHAASLLAAHYGALYQRGPVSGVVTSQTVGPVTQAYAAPLVAGGLESTSYGSEYQRLVRTQAAFRMAVVL